MATDTDYILVKMKLVDARRFQLEAAATAGSIKKIGQASDTAGKSMEHASRRGFLLNQMMFTARRLIYAATLALGGFSTMAIVSGIRFNATMEQNTIALTQFLGGARAARKELRYLYHLAATTPFETTSVVDAAKKFLAFGFTVKQTNAYLRVIADTASAFGLSAEGIDRMVIAFGQIQAKGRVMGDEILQLQEIGIPAMRILQEELGLTSKQMKNIGLLGIKSSVAIPALMYGLQKRYHGMSQNQAKSVMGLWSTLKDNARMMFGVLTEDLFVDIKKKYLPAVMRLTAAMQAGAKRGGFQGAIAAMDAQLGAGGKILRFWIDLRTILFSIWKLLKVTLIPALGILYTAFQPLMLFSAFAGVLKFLTRHTRLVTAAFFAWATWLAIAKIRLVALWIVQKRKLFFDKIVLFWTWAGVTALEAQAMWTSRLTVREALATKTTKGLATAMVLLTKRLWLAVRSLIAMGAAWLAGLGPVGWIILAVALIIAGLAILYFKWKRFHDFMDSIFGWMKRHWRLMMLLPVSTLAFGILLLIKYFDSVKRVLSRFFVWVGGKIDWLGKKLAGLWNKIKRIPGWIGGGAGLLNPTRYFASGGTMPFAGTAVVGERGPELITLPGGARVEPIKSTVAPLGSMTQVSLGVVEIPVTLKVDGRTLAEANARAVLKVEARA